MGALTVAKGLKPVALPKSNQKNLGNTTKTHRNVVTKSNVSSEESRKSEELQIVTKSWTPPL